MSLFPVILPKGRTLRDSGNKSVNYDTSILPLSMLPRARGYAQARGIYYITNTSKRASQTPFQAKSNIRTYTAVSLKREDVYVRKS